MDAPHEASLGRLLGYPPCCCEFVAECGETRIDELAGEVARWAFRDIYQLIDPTHTPRADRLSAICLVHRPATARWR